MVYGLSQFLTNCCIYATIYTMKATKDKTPTPVIHNRLPVLRAERNLSRQDLADAVGINFQTIGYLERSDYNPSLELAFKLSEFFGLPIEAIFSKTPFKPLSESLYKKGVV